MKILLEISDKEIINGLAERFDKPYVYGCYCSWKNFLNLDIYFEYAAVIHLHIYLFFIGLCVIL
jgi:hypothetical protein